MQKKLSPDLVYPGVLKFHFLMVYLSVSGFNLMEVLFTVVF